MPCRSSPPFVRAPRSLFFRVRHGTAECQSRWADGMTTDVSATFEDHGLTAAKATILEFEQPALGFALTRAGHDRLSHFGGKAHVPEGFAWPQNRGRKLDLLLQICLADIRGPHQNNRLPGDGVLSFFYDLEDQPWGYDPKNLHGFYVSYFDSRDLVVTENPNVEYVLPSMGLNFFRVRTLPRQGSRAYDRLVGRIDADLADRYFDFVEDFERNQYPPGGGMHRFFGHSANIQGDMQLEAQLVTNGLYCGDSSGYNNPRRRELEGGVEDWTLLLQLDSDELSDHGDAEIMWGDTGMLYFWMRQQDLERGSFQKVWMTMQCC